MNRYKKRYTGLMMSKFWSLIFAVLLCSGIHANPASEVEKPNILWVLVEDMSQDLGCYGNELVTTPNIDQLAEMGMRFENVFTTGPACSPSRTALNTGVYQTTLGAYHMRYPDELMPVLPDAVQTLPELMRENGYFTGNIKGICGTGKGKDDWLFKTTRKTWDTQSWDELVSRQPFYGQVNMFESHRPFAREAQATVDANRVKLPPYYPDHEISRDDWAGYLADVNRADERVGDILEKLKEDGLAESTIVIFFSDHGRPMMRAKNWLYDSGTKIPLVVYIPEGVEAPDGFQRGGSSCRLLSGVDLTAQTVLLAGGSIPSWMQGRGFLEKDAIPRDEVFTAVDRIGNINSQSRAIRTHHYKYIRNFKTPGSVNDCATPYRRAMHPIHHLLEVMGERSLLSANQAQLLETIAPEELYDLRIDPHETTNLVGNPDYDKVHKRLKKQLESWIKESGDRGFEPDSEAVIEYFENYGKATTAQLQKYGSTNTDQLALKYQETRKRVVSAISANPMPSPDGKVSADLYSGKNGELRYHVSFKDSQVVESSGIGITVDGIDLGADVFLGKPKKSLVDESYATRGNHKRARNHYSLWDFPVKHKKSDKQYSLQFRIYNDGVAYRYIVPGKGSQHVDGERSSWTMMPGARTWYFERLTPGWKLKSYAGEWIATDIETLETATPAKVGPVQGTPLVFDLPHSLGYAAVTKAACYNYSGMRLRAVGNRTVVADFTEGEDGFDVDGTIVTPWRVTLLADDLDELVNSDLINNLNPAPDPELFADTSYIKPGRSVWSWESIGLGTPEDQRDFVDYAAELGFEYSIVDDGWKEWDDPWGTIQSLCNHARTKDVGVWVWVHSNDIDDPAGDYQQMRDYFEKAATAGVVGIKTDFMNGETKVLIDFEIACLRLAAEHKLMINFHGCHSSTGEERTYPNEVTREGIRGMEVNKMKEGPLPASHNAALPFTRFVVGQADYTPILYTNPGPTTFAHQLATPVIYNSPLQVYAEHPETMMKHPVLKDACPVMQAIPTVWDETKVLPGSEIGGLAAFARRKGDTWFIAVLNGAEKRTYELNLGFLPSGHFEAVVVSDDLNAEPVNVAGLGINQKAKQKQWTTAVPFKVEEQQVSDSTIWSISLAEGGGFVAMLKKE